MQQQTAVEWLIEQLQAPCRGIPSHIIEQAKVMEADQSDRDYNQGFSDGYNEGYDKGMSDYNRF